MVVEVNGACSAEQQRVGSTSKFKQSHHNITSMEKSYWLSDHLSMCYIEICQNDIEMLLDSWIRRPSDTEGGCSLSPINQISEMQPLRKLIQTQQNPLGESQTQRSRTRGLLNFPENSLKNWA